MHPFSRFLHILTAATLSVAALTLAQAGDKPNVILIMADDLGYGDLSCYGSTRLKTPHLDKLAAEGVRLTDFHAGATVCTPSRMALLTGAYPTRLGWPGGVMGYKIGRKNGLSGEALTMAEIFKSHGYTTGLSGKWHLGDAEGMTPMAQGFDSAFHIKMSNNQTKKLWRGDELVADPFDNRLLTEQFTTEALRFIRENKSNSFFLYLPYTAPHFPAQAHPEWKDKSENHAYGDVVEELDSRIGDIMEVLKTAEIDQKTIVVFTSDNGPDPSQKKWASAEPYRGLKWSSLEGGTRVPCLIRWPGIVPAGRTFDGLASAIDILPTLADACGIPLSAITKETPKIDGVNLWNALTGKESGAGGRGHLLYWNGWAKAEAVRAGEWKLFFAGVKDVPGSDKGPALFNLKHDPAESVNLSAAHPDKVTELQTLAAKLKQDIQDNSIPLGGPIAK